MQAKELCRRVRQLALPLAEQRGVALWDVSFEKEGGAYLLTVTIDAADHPADLEACEGVSRALDPLLDAREFDSLPSYTLCVSSAGLTRKLTRPEHFEACRGQRVAVSLYRAVDGAREYVGALDGWREDELVLTDEGKEYRLKRGDVAAVHLALDF